MKILVKESVEMYELCSTTTSKLLNVPSDIPLNPIPAKMITPSASVQTKAYFTITR